jgi:hypothetical protein
MKNSSSRQSKRVCAILGAALIALAASTATAQRVEEVIEKNIKAQGGRDALLNLKALERKGDVSLDGTFGQMDGTVKEFCIPWKKARRSLDLAVFVQDDGYDGKIAWRNGMMGIQDLEGEEASQIKQAVNLNPFVMIAKNGTKAEKLDDESIEDVACYVVQLSPMTGPKAKIFIDKATDQIMRTKLTVNNPQFGMIDIVVDNADYKEFGPVKLATKESVVFGELFQVETTYTETKVDGEIDESMFEKPKEPAKEPAKDAAKDAPKDGQK